MKLGQPINTLSSGETQRLKLASELTSRKEIHTLYLLDEDVEKLLTVIQHLIEDGNTVIVIEHNHDMIAAADWIIDLDPEGGEIVFSGKPLDSKKEKNSRTGAYL